MHIYRFLGKCHEAILRLDKTDTCLLRFYSPDSSFSILFGILPKSYIVGRVQYTLDSITFRSIFEQVLIYILHTTVSKYIDTYVGKLYI